MDENTTPPSSAYLLKFSEIKALLGRQFPTARAVEIVERPGFPRPAVDPGFGARWRWWPRKAVQAWCDANLIGNTHTETATHE